MRRQIGTVVCLGTVALPRLAAQWSIATEVGVARFAGGSTHTSGSPDSFSLRPFRPTTFGIEVGREAGRTRIGVGLLYAKPGLVAEGGRLAAVDYDGMKLLELAPEISLRIARVGSGGALRLAAGPAFDFWTLQGSADRTRAGGRATAAWEWPVTTHLRGSVRAGVVFTGSVFNEPELPGTVAPRGAAAWPWACATASEPTPRPYDARRPGSSPGRLPDPTARPTPLFPGQHPAPQRAEPPPNRSVEDPVSHADHDAAENRLVRSEMRPHLLAENLRQPPDEAALEPAVGRGGERYPGVHPVELDVHERLILEGDLAEEALPAASHHGLEEPHELPRRRALERALQDQGLGRLRYARGFERHGDALVGGDGARDRVHQPPVALHLAAGVGGREQRLRVVPRDRRALQCFFSRLAR